MKGHPFNQRLYSLRVSALLSRREAAKGAHLSLLSLYLLEKGYLRIGKKAKEKLEAFYGVSLDFSKEEEYPVALEEEKAEARPKKRKVLIRGIFTAVMAVFLALGATIFIRSTRNDASFYGQSYREVYSACSASGKVGTDLITNSTYHYLQPKDGSAFSCILFYDSSSFLNFSECRYSVNVILGDRPDIGTCRLDFRFGGDMASDSHLCYFTFGSITYGSVYSAVVPYFGEGVGSIKNAKTHVEGERSFDEETLTMLYNLYIEESVRSFEMIMEDHLGKKVSFLSSFLVDREQGRNVAFFSQIFGLSLLLAGLVGLFVGLWQFGLSLLKRFHPLKAKIKEGPSSRELPKDFSFPIVLPDFFLIWASRVFFAVSLIFILLSFLGNFGVSLPPILTNPSFVNVWRTLFSIGPFIRLLLACFNNSEGGIILLRSAKNFLIFLFLAGVETAIIAVTNAWGYDFSEILFDLIPGSLFQVVALLFLLHFFLAYTPAFLEGEKRWPVLLWRLLSLLPLSMLMASAILSNAHLLFVDFSKNLFLSFWFPSFVLPATIICVLALYGYFFLRLFFRSRYGKKASLYFNGFRFALIANLLTVAILLSVYALILLLKENEYAYYLGLVNGEWILGLIPFALLCKASPSPYGDQEEIEASLRLE